jgi:probable O-glycosylation ligase (exosortase A-associated)
MRSALVMAIILGSIPICFFSPYFGIVMWSWIAYLNPHRFTYGMAYDFPVAYAIGLPTLAGLLFAQDRNRQIFTKETILLLALWTWFGITLLYAMNVPIFVTHIASAKLQMIKVSKILLMTLVSLIVVTSREKLRSLCLVIAFSIGALCVKGAMFGLRTSGESRVWGPPDSFLADNNALGLTINMTLPIFFFLAREEKNVWFRWLLRICFVSGILASILTYSRGALLGLAVALAAIAVKSRRKFLSGVALTLCAIIVVSYAPEKWMDRMGEFLQGKLDSSAQGRLNAWHFAVVFTESYPITGGGFQTFTPDLFERFTPELTFAGPHSIYFQVLGEHGYVGLFLFLLLLATAWRTLRNLRKPTWLLPSTIWVINYSHMLESSLYAFMVSGAFLPLAYFDYFFQIVALIIVTKIIYLREVEGWSVQRREQPQFTPVEEAMTA